MYAINFPPQIFSREFCFQVMKNKILRLKGVALGDAILKCSPLYNCAAFTYCANKELLCRSSRRETADAQVCANWVALRKNVVLLAPSICFNLVLFQVG